MLCSEFSSVNGPWPVPGTEAKPFKDIFDPEVAADFEPQAGQGGIFLNSLICYVIHPLISDPKILYRDGAPGR